MERIRVHTIRKTSPESVWDEIVKLFKWDSKEVFHKDRTWMVSNTLNGKGLEKRGYVITLIIERFRGKARLHIWENIPNAESEVRLMNDMKLDMLEAHKIIKSLQ